MTRPEAITARNAEDPVRLAHVTSLPVLGIRVRFESDDPRPLEVAEEAFGAWRTLESRPDLIDERQVRVRISVVPGQEGGSLHAPLDHRIPEPRRLVITSPGSRAVSDVALREADIRVSETLLEDRQHFRYGVLESATLFVLAYQDRQPVHAAVVMRAGAALLLAGPSGAGKSTLAYAAASRLGCHVLAEDVVSVQLRPALRLWGLPGFLHLPADSGTHFRELSGRAPTLRANGKVKIAVALARIGALPRLPLATRAGICVLEPGHGSASLEPLDAAAVTEALMRRIEPGFDLFADTVGDCVAAMAASGGWRLRTTARPSDVFPLLDRALAAVAGAREPERNGSGTAAPGNG